MVVALETGAGDEGLEAAGAAAMAERSGALVVARAGQRVVTPLAGDSVASPERAAADRDAGPGARSR
jgi:hypothetical protein